MDIKEELQKERKILVLMLQHHQRVALEARKGIEEIDRKLSILL